MSAITSAARPAAAGPDGPRVRGSPPAADWRAGRSNAHESRCRHTRSAEWSKTDNTASQSGPANRVRAGCSTHTSTGASVADSSTRPTFHGVSSPGRWRYSSVSRIRHSVGDRPSRPNRTHVKPGSALKLEAWVRPGRSGASPVLRSSHRRASLRSRPSGDGSGCSLR